MKENSTMGSRIREQRKKMGMTQEELAERLFTKKGTISAYENDRIDMKCSVAKEIARNLECSVSYLIEGEEIELDVDCVELLRQFRNLKSEMIRKVAVEQIKILKSIKYNEINS